MSFLIRIITTRDERFRYQFEENEKIVFTSQITYPTRISAVEHALLEMKTQSDRQAA